MLNQKDYELKPISEQDLKIVRKWRNSKKIKSFMYTDHHITWEEHRRWFENLRKDSQKKVLLLHHKKQPLGLVNFTELDKKNGRCYWGFYIGKKVHPKGLGPLWGF